MVPAKIYFHKELESNPINPTYWLMYCHYRIRLLSKMELYILNKLEEGNKDKEYLDYMKELFNKTFK